MMAQRPDPFACISFHIVVGPQMVHMEIVLRSLIAQRPDLIPNDLEFHLETVLRSFIAQRPDHFKPLPTEGSARVDTEEPK